jgi:hypothetical protein
MVSSCNQLLDPTRLCTYTTLAILGGAVSGRSWARASGLRTGSGSGASGSRRGSRGLARRGRCPSRRSGRARARYSKGRLQDGHVGVVRYSVGRLEAVHVVTPPRSCGPPKSTLPHIFALVVSALC